MKTFQDYGRLWFASVIIVGLSFIIMMLEVSQYGAKALNPSFEGAWMVEACTAFFIIVSINCYIKGQRLYREYIKKVGIPWK